MKTNLNKFFTFRNILKKCSLRKQNLLGLNKSEINTEINYVNSLKWEHSNRIDKLRINETFSEFKIKTK